jgi:DNA polymerase III delta prime subunit
MFDEKLTIKYAPKALEDVCLLDRIKDQFKNGVTNHYILSGDAGIGKTTLAKILSGYYTKKSQVLFKNGSLDTSIDNIRDEVDEFCSTRFINAFFDDDEVDTNQAGFSDGFRYVIIDEFERLSNQAQDALKSLIEKYETTTRFIFTTNHPNKISAPILSRVPLINFKWENEDEYKELKRKLSNRVKDILTKEDIQIPKEDIITIFNDCFPDMRLILNKIQAYQLTGKSNAVESTSEDNEMVFDVVFNKDHTYNTIYDILCRKLGNGNPDKILHSLGVPLIKFVGENHPAKIPKLFEANAFLADTEHILPDSSNPLITVMALIGKLRNLFK